MFVMKTCALVVLLHAAASLEARSVVKRLYPTMVGLQGGARLHLEGLELYDLDHIHETKVFVGEKECELLPELDKSTAKSIACRLPVLVEGVHQVRLWVGTDHQTALCEASSSCQLVATPQLNAEGLLFQPRLQGAGGDAVHIISHNEWNTSNNIEVQIGGVSVPLDNSESKYVPSNGGERVAHLQVRIPQGVTAGLHDVDVHLHALPSHPYANGRVQLLSNAKQVLVRPLISSIVTSYASEELVLHVGGAGFSIDKIENKAVLAGRPCTVLEADYHFLHLTCPQVPSVELQDENDGNSHDNGTELDDGLLLHRTNTIVTTETERIHLTTACEWPPEEPTHRDHGYSFSSFSLNAYPNETFFTPPESAFYRFSLSCEGDPNAFLRIGDARDETIGWFQKDHKYGVKLNCKYTIHGKSARISASWSPSLSGFNSGTYRSIGSVPAAWFLHTKPRENSATVKLEVNGIRSVCRCPHNCHIQRLIRQVPLYTGAPSLPEQFRARESEGVHHLRVLANYPNGATPFSEWVQSTGCRACVIPIGQAFYVDKDVELDSLVVRGQLFWQASNSGQQVTTLRTGFLAVEQNGVLEIDGSTDHGKRFVLYLKNNGREHPKIGPVSLGTVGGNGQPSLRIRGFPLRRTWSLLRHNHPKGATSLDLIDDIAGMGWKIGDRIAIAPAGLPATSRSTFVGPQIFEIAGIQGSQIQLGPGASLAQLYLGDAARSMQCEVINLSRNVLVTGDPFNQMKGLHVIGYGKGTLQVSHTRLEKCGRRGELARYCLHFHYMGSCPECLFRGNAIEDSQQRGIVIHETHRSLVEENVLFAVRGSGIYVEDGNEMFNIVKDNVNICHQSAAQPNACKAPGTDNVLADEIHQSGIWAISVSNDFIGNRNANHEHGFFTQVSAFPFGRGAARNRVCTVHAPFGKFQGNVQHSNWRFGFYLDVNWPRSIRRSPEGSDGYVEDMEDCWAGKPCSCSTFRTDGSDNGQVGVVEDIVDWGNDFVGQYELGDVQYLRKVSVNNLKNMYWKHTKNFADGVSSHIKDSVFGWYNDLGTLGYPSSGVAHILGPGGHGTFVIERTRFFGSMVEGAICANQHCGIGPGTGGLCTPTFHLVDVDLSGLPQNRKAVRFGVSDGNTELPMFSSNKPFLDNFVSVASKHQDHLLSVPGSPCIRASSIGKAAFFDDGILCTQPLRRLQVWSQDQGSLTLTGPGGGTYEMKFILPCPGGENCRKKQGYGAVLLVPPSSEASSWSYALDVDRNFHPDNQGPKVTIEYSDPVFAKRFGLSEVVQLRLNGGLCTLEPAHDRSFIGPFGPFEGARGACMDVQVPNCDTVLVNAGYPECEARTTWLLENWNKVSWSDTYVKHGIDGSLCSVRRYLAEQESYCPACFCSEGSQTVTPTTYPTKKPTASPTRKPTTRPTDKPTESPTNKPTARPTLKPTESPTQQPSARPTEMPTVSPSRHSTCSGPYTEHPTCAARIQWMMENWDTVPWTDVYRKGGVDGSECSIQQYLARVEGFCPDCTC